jgi:hypothetical protein
MHNFAFDRFKHYQSLALQHKINKSHHKCIKITCVFIKINFISTPPFNSKIQILKHINKKTQHEFH